MAKALRAPKNIEEKTLKEAKDNKGVKGVCADCRETEQSFGVCFHCIRYWTDT